MPSLHEVLSALVEGEDREQVQAVLGSWSSQEMDKALRDVVRGGLGVEIASCAYHYVSVGVTLELSISDGRKVVLKACRGTETHRHGAIEVQHHLASHGFPAPEVLLWPTPCLDAEVYVMSAVSRGDRVVYDATVRDALAVGYAQLIASAKSLPSTLPLADKIRKDGRLWPTPHSVIFDFEETRNSAAPIDAIAAQAQALVLDSIAHTPSVIAHGDWSLQNIALHRGQLVGVFDWDSIIRTPEPVAVASAAVFHQQDWRYGPEDCDHDFYPGPQGAWAFADVYAHERGAPWSHEERRTLNAAMVYSLGYQARCQHAFDPTVVGPAAQRLNTFAKAFGLA